MNMNTLLNEDNEGYSWEGDYEQTWYLIFYTAKITWHYLYLKSDFDKGKKSKKMQKREIYVLPLTIKCIGLAKGNFLKNNRILDYLW
jgi:hypothetical protein